MLIGSFSGELFLRMNEGTRTHPEFSGDSISVKASGEPIKVNGHACPAVADWNHDGKWEIVLGSDIGCVGWHENIGSLKEPNFGPFQVLIPAVADQKFFVQELESGETPKPGVRTQICVADHNLDGRMDLLVGDLSKIKVKRELSEDDVAAKAKLTEDIKEISGKLKELGYADEKEEERQKLIEQLMSFMENEKAFYESARESSYVWLYLRSDSSNANVESPTDSNSSNQKITGPDNNNIWMALQYLDGTFCPDGKIKDVSQPVADFISEWQGKDDQKIYVVQGIDLVVVRLGNAADRSSPALSNFDSEFLGTVCKAFKP